MLQKLEVVDLGVIWQKTQLPFICIFKNRLSNRDPIREQEERKYSVKNVQKFYVTLNIFLQLLYHPFQLSTHLNSRRFEERGETPV